MIATGTPRANGQIERINRQLTTMLSKLTNERDDWDEVIDEVEYSMNNTLNKSTNFTPSMLLFGTNQRRTELDTLMDKIVEVIEPERNLEEIRMKAEENIEKSQNYSKAYYDAKHKLPQKYKENELVMIINNDVTPGVNKKLLPKYRGPYVVKRVLSNDRYYIEDVEGHEVTQIPYKGIIEAGRMKKWVRNS